MNVVDRRLWAAVEFKMDPKVVSPSGTRFAWFPVYGWDHQQRRHRRLWLEKVIWFRPLCLLTEYSTYAGSEAEFNAKHGRYSWQPEGFDRGGYESKFYDKHGRFSWEKAR